MDYQIPPQLSNEAQMDKAGLEDFFSHLKALAIWQMETIGEKPSKLVISPLVLRVLARSTGFFQRPELRSEVTTYSPVVSRMLIDPIGIVRIKEDAGEAFLHFE